MEGTNILWQCLCTWELGRNWPLSAVPQSATRCWTRILSNHHIGAVTDLEPGAAVDDEDLEGEQARTVEGLEAEPVGSCREGEASDHGRRGVECHGRCVGDGSSLEGGRCCWKRWSKADGAEGPRMTGVKAGGSMDKGVSALLSGFQRAGRWIPLLPALVQHNKGVKTQSSQHLASKLGWRQISGSGRELQSVRGIFERWATRDFANDAWSSFWHTRKSYDVRRVLQFTYKWIHTFQNRPSQNMEESQVCFGGSASS